MVRNELFSVALDYLYKNGLVADQRELSEKTGITETTISRILNNKVRQPSDETLRRLNAAFGHIFNMQYFRGESDTLLTNEEQKPEIDVNPRFGIGELYAQLIHEVEGLRTELNAQIKEVKKEREQLREERESLRAISQQLTTALAGIQRAQYPTASPRPLMFADGSPSQPTQQQTPQ